MNKLYQQHEQNKKAPGMPDKKFQVFQHSIQQTGFLKQYPIILYEGKILDGWNRYRACVSSSIEPVFDKYEGKDPEGYVMAAANRKDHTASQLACFAVELEPRFTKELKDKETERKKGTKGASTLSQGRAIDLAAKEVGVGIQWATKAKSIRNKRPDLFEQIKQGEIDIKQAENIIYKEKKAKLKDRSKIVMSSENYHYSNKDLLEADIPDNSINVIITDPPYPRSFLPCWNKLAQFAVKKLKDGGVLIAASGHSYLPEVYAAMTIEGLLYHWTGCIYQPGVSADLCVKRINTHWKPLLIYTKGKYTGLYQGTDTYISEYEDITKGQEFHKWGQNLKVFSKIVDDWTTKDDVVCDPFLGGGTTGVACIGKCKDFYGNELDKETLDIAKARIAEACEALGGK